MTIYDMKYDINKFDTSDYSIDNPYDIPFANKKIPSLMKDENNGASWLNSLGLERKYMFYMLKYNICFMCTRKEGQR